MSLFSKILIASDGSEPSMRAARIGTKIGELIGAQVTIVTVAYVPKMYALDMSREMKQAYHDDWKKVLEDTISQVSSKVEAKLIEGDSPAQALLDEIKLGSYDLVIVGRTGTGSPGSYVMGSVTRRLAEEAKCAVLIVR